MLNAWKMPKPVLDSFERFNSDRLVSVFATYTSLTTPEAYSRFFRFFVSEILGNHVSWTPEDVSASGLEEILKVQLVNLDPFLSTKVSSAFTYLQAQIRDYVAKFWDRT